MDLIRRNFGLKVAALLTAIILWFTFNYLSAGPSYNKTIELPLTLRGVATGMVASTNIHMTSVELTGPRSQLEQWTPDGFTAYVDCAGKHEGTYALNITVTGADADKIVSVTPRAVVVLLDRYTFRRVPVVINTNEGVRLSDFEPRTVIVAGGASDVSRVIAVQASIDTDPGPSRTLLTLKPVAVDARLLPINGLTVAPASIRVAVLQRRTRS